MSFRRPSVGSAALSIPLSRSASAKMSCRQLSLPPSSRATSATMVNARSGRDGVWLARVVAQVWGGLGCSGSCMLGLGLPREAWQVIRIGP